MAILLWICATLHHTKEDGYIFAAAKIKQSRRQITLATRARDALCSHRARQAEERLKLGVAWDGTPDLEFPN